MKIHKLTFVILIALPAFIVSCSNDDDPAPRPAKPQGTMLISREFDSDDTNPLISANTFVYDADNKLTSQLTDDDSREYTRNADGKVIKATISDAFDTYVMRYTYMGNGKLQKVERTNPALEVIETREYTYLSNRIEEHQFNSTGSLIGITAFYYSADGKNTDLIKRYYGDGTLVAAEIYAFDGKKGLDQIAPYSNLPKSFYNANNATSITYQDASGTIIGTRDFSLTYDTSGNPLTIIDNTYASNRKMNFEYIEK